MRDYPIPPSERSVRFLFAILIGVAILGATFASTIVDGGDTSPSTTSP